MLKYLKWIVVASLTVFILIACSNHSNIDATKPIIKLKGSTPITINIGDEYKDAGAIATDNIDGDITSEIVEESTVDTSKLGTYKVTYNVTDKAGNEADEVVRVVKVANLFKGYIKKMVIWHSCISYQAPFITIWKTMIMPFLNTEKPLN